MAWRAIIADDLETVLLGPELEAIRRVAGASDGSDDDKLGAVIATVTDECRAAIEDCPENRLGAAGTLPERVIHHALAIIRHRLLTRVKMASSEERTQEYRDARRFFERVSNCEVKIELPDDEDVVQEANTPEIDVVLETENQQMGKSNLQGLFALAIAALLLSLVSCSQGMRRDFGFVPKCLEERVWDEERNAVVTREVCLVPSFYQRICKECGHGRPGHFPWCDPTRRERRASL